MWGTGQKERKILSRVFSKQNYRNVLYYRQYDACKSKCVLFTLSFPLDCSCVSPETPEYCWGPGSITHTNAQLGQYHVDSKIPHTPNTLSDRNSRLEDALYLPVSSLGTLIITLNINHTPNQFSTPSHMSKLSAHTGTGPKLHFNSLLLFFV